MKRTAIGAGLCLAAIVLSGAAHADEAPAHALSGSVSLASDYRFRGLSQTDLRPAAQAGLEEDFSGGAYVGGWASNVSWLADTSTPAQPVSNSLEVDAYAGRRGQFGAGWRWDAGLCEYAYPGRYPHGYTRPYTLEGHAMLGWRTLSLEYARSFGNLFGVAASHGSDYLEVSWHQPLARGWVLAAHLGRQRVAGHAAAAYTEWKFGVSRDLGQGWSLALAWHATNARRALYSNTRGDYLGRAAALASVTRTF